MGHTSYSHGDRSVRAASAGYYTKSIDDVFIQNKKRVIHESMKPEKALLREARDSDTHPASVPIIIALDLTGSMGGIPHYLVKDGLPNTVASIIQRGVLDPAILFIGVGDHECDRHPLQVGQFESGDAELDLWLTRTYLEGGGGGNEGESYLLAWYFASLHTVTDAWDKRKEKGFLFTIGDEPCLRSLPHQAVTEIMDTPSQKSYSDKELLALAQEKYNVYHLHVMEGSAGHRSLGYWKELLGDHCIVIENKEDIGKKIADIVTSNSNHSSVTAPNVHTVVDTTSSPSTEILL